VRRAAALKTLAIMVNFLQSKTSPPVYDEYEGKARGCYLVLQVEVWHENTLPCQSILETCGTDMGQGAVVRSGLKSTFSMKLENHAHIGRAMCPLVQLRPGSQGDGTTNETRL
jgi:hypothetical protein